MICGKKARKGEGAKGRKGKTLSSGFWLLASGFWLLASCNYTKNLTQTEYALTRNTVKVEGIKGDQFDDLIDLVRPIPNKKFMGVFPIKVSLWAYHQPKFDSITGKVKDSKFNRWCRKNGAPPVLLDSADLQRSVRQIELAMFKRGYFNATARAEVKLLKKQKSKASYFVTPNHPYYIRNIEYQIDIPEYRRIVIMDTANALIKTGMLYSEEDLVAERARMVSRIKDEGYFYAVPEVVTFLVDTNNAFGYLNKHQHPTVAITVKISYDDVNDASLIAKGKNRYRFNNALIYTNYDLNFDKNVHLDTIPYLDFRSKSDSTLYEFVSLKKIKKRTHKLKLIKDYHSRTIADAIWMKRGDLYSQTAYARTYKKLRDLRNFSIINIAYHEDETLWDSISKIGALNTTVRLTRVKQHEIESNFATRTDRTSLHLSYINKNIFRGAEYLKISAYGSVYYYTWLNSLIKNNIPSDALMVYGEVGGTTAFEFPRLLMLPKYQNINYLSYSTEIKFSASYTQLFSRLYLQAAYTYKWNPTQRLSHSISPVELASLDSRGRDTTIISQYPQSYRRKFEPFFIPSARYTLKYMVRDKNTHPIFYVNFSFETAGLMLYSINAAVNKNDMWKVFNSYNYGTYEKFDLELNYKKIINRKNSLATRFIFGMAIPFKKGTVIPFERSFFVGGSNSMRGWTFRQLGPGGFYHDGQDVVIERVGDMKLELNLEYRGSIYKAFKFGVFTDIGNVWLLSKYEDMPNAEFNFKTFYKQIAFCVGVGLHLDFNFFLIRLDYGLPIYDPSNPIGNYWINKRWFNKENPWWTATQGIQFGIGYAF
jgi:outer membrane protein assembly factor BamA